jgi:serine/threonine protein kinase
VVKTNIKNTTNIIQIDQNAIEQALNQKEETDLLLISRNFTHSFIKKPFNFRSTISVQKPQDSPKYIKGQCIGSGFFGQVYSGLSLNTGEIVAIKTIKFNGDMKTIEFKKQNIRESVIKLSHLKHKNIIKYMCTQETSKDEIDLIVEYCNGGSIKQLIEKFSAFDEKLIKLYVKQILEGLVYLHDLGIVHRNIKNTNILVDGTGVVKITDLVVSNILVGDEPDKILSYSTMNGKGKIEVI